MLETNMSEVLTHVEAQSKLEKSETSASSIVKVWNMTEGELDGQEARYRYKKTSRRRCRQMQTSRTGQTERLANRQTD